MEFRHPTSEFRCRTPRPRAASAPSTGIKAMTAPVWFESVSAHRKLHEAGACSCELHVRVRVACVCDRGCSGRFPRMRAASSSVVLSRISLMCSVSS